MNKRHMVYCASAKPQPLNLSLLISDVNQAQPQSQTQPLQPLSLNSSISTFTIQALNLKPLNLRYWQ